ncbi:MAG: pilus assembly protein CpaB [Bermanella sp.]|jgi:pilus assembly protein CpaB
MQAQTLKILAFSLIGLSVLLAFVGIKLSQEPAANAVALAPQSPYSVIVASRDIEPNTTITTDDVQLIPYPLSTGGTYTKIEELLGKEVFLPVPKGEVLRTTHFEMSSVLSEQVRPGFRAMAVSVDETIGTGGYLLPGDKVDVIFATRANRETNNRSVARRILTDITVLAFGNVIQGNAIQGKSEKPEEPSGKRSRTAVLEILEGDISELLLAETSGTLRLAAVGNSETDAKKLEIEPEKRQEVRASIADLVGTAVKRRPPPRVYVYHGDSVETVRTQP